MRGIYREREKKVLFMILISLGVILKIVFENIRDLEN